MAIEITSEDLLSRLPDTNCILLKKYSVYALQWRTQRGKPRGFGTPKENGKKEINVATIEVIQELCKKKRKLDFILYINFYNHLMNFIEFAVKIFFFIQFNSPQD